MESKKKMHGTYEKEMALSSEAKLYISLHMTILE